jgi:hypothetical protein
MPLTLDDYRLWFEADTGLTVAQQIDLGMTPRPCSCIGSGCPGWWMETKHEREADQ